MYSMPDALVEISASHSAFFFAHRFTIPTNRTSQGVIRGENAGIAREVFAWSGNLRGQAFKEFASGHRNRSGAIAPRTFEGVSKATVAPQGESFGGNWTAGEIASKTFETLSIVGVDGHIGVQGI